LGGVIFLGGETFLYKTARCIGLALGGVTLIAQASALTIATFDDPAIDSTHPTFRFTSTGPGFTGFLRGTNIGPNLPTLLMPGFVGGGSQPLCRWKMSDLNVDANGVATAAAGGRGFVDFTDVTQTHPVFHIDFDSALFSNFGLGASTQFGNNVTFGGDRLPNPLTNERFAFSFANGLFNALTGNLEYTAAFTSSAVIPVPEPASILAVSLGVFGFARRRGRTRRATV
jgi:hypothetical protein